MEKELKAAVIAVKSAGVIVKKYFRKDIKLFYKDKKKIDLVTEVDFKSQKIIVDVLSKNFSYNYLCEEKDSFLPRVQSEYMWVIDPLDGTTNFFHGIDQFNISIALARGGEVILGVVYQPISNEIFLAIKGKGAWFNNKKVRVSKTKQLNKSLVLCNYNYSDAHRKEILNNINKLFLKVGYFRMFNSAGLELTYLGTGRIDALVVYKAYPWDVAAGGLIAQEAGGKVTNLDGGKWDFLNGNLIASNSLVHSQILKVLKG